MKSIIIATLSIFFGLGFFGENKEIRELPKYNPKLQLAVEGCQCTGGFCSASSDCPSQTTCSCSCGLFKCSCTTCVPAQNNASIKDNSPVSVSKEQYVNIEKVAKILTEDNSTKAIEAYNNLYAMVDNLTVTKYSEYHEQSDKLVANLKMLSNETKKKINDFISTLGIEERI